MERATTPLLRQTAQQRKEKKAMGSDRVQWIVEGLIARGDIVVLAGPPKRAMKTWISLHLALCVMRGEPFLGMPTVKSKVSLLNFDDGYERIRQRFQLLGETDESQLPVFVEGGKMSPVSAAECVAANPPQLLIIDSSLSWRASISDEMAPFEPRSLFELRTLARHHGMAILLLHPQDYGKDGDPRGSMLLRATADGWIDARRNVLPSSIRITWATRGAPDGGAVIELVADGDRLVLKQQD